MNLLILVSMLFTVEVSLGLSLRRRDTTVGSPGKPAALECEFSELVEFCGFIRPDGLEVCQGGRNIDLVREDCVQSTDLQVQANEKKCILSIEEVAEDHFGSWTCKAMYWEDWVDGTVDLIPMKTGLLEIQDVWGTLILNTEVQHTLTCRLNLDDPLEEAYKGRIIKWELSEAGERTELEGALVKKDKEGQEFESNLELTVTPEDDGKQLYCFSPITGEEDSILLELYQFVPPSGEDALSQEVEEGQEAVFNLQFSSYPHKSSKSEFWIEVTAHIDDGTVETVTAGDSTDKVEVGTIKYSGKDHIHSVQIIIKNVTKEDTEKKYSLSMVLKDLVTKDLMVPLTLSVKDSTVLPEVPEEVAEAVNRPSYLPATQVPGNETLIIDTLAKKEGVSLYIIIAIVVLCSFLCIMYYSLRCCRNEENKNYDPELAPMVLEEKSQPLLPKLVEEKGETNTLLQDASEMESAVRVNGEIITKDPEERAIEEKTKELELLLLSTRANGNKILKENENKLQSNPNVENPFDSSKEDVPKMEPIIEKQIKQELSQAPAFKNEHEVQENTVESRSLHGEDLNDGQSSRNSLDSQIQESLNQILSTLNNNDDIEANKNGKPSKEEIPSAPLERSQIEIPLKMTLKLHSPDLLNREEKSYSSYFNQKEIESPTHVNKPDSKFQVELVVNLTPPLTPAKRDQEVERNGLFSPGLVMNSAAEVRPPNGVRVPSQQSKSDERPPKAPRTNPRAKHSIEIQTDKVAPKVLQADRSFIRSRSNSIDAGTQTPQMMARVFDFDKADSDSDDSIVGKSKKETLLEEIEKLKEEMMDVKRRMSSSIPTSPKSTTSLEGDQSMYLG